MAARSNSESYYNILEISETADSSAISASYRRLAKLRHPDKSLDNPQATAVFQKLQEAYSILINAESRANYDRTRPRQSHESAVPRKKNTKYKFYSFNVGESWERRTASSHDETSCPPSTHDPLERDIRNIRRQVNEDEIALFKAKKDENDIVNEIDNVWRQIHSTEDFIKQVDNELLFLVKTPGFLGRGFSHIDGLATIRSTQRVGGGEATLLNQRHKLKEEMEQLRQQLETNTASSRVHVTKTEEITLRKAQREEELHDLCKAWRAREFHGGEKTESDSWSGWDGWCCWDRQETEFGWEEKQQNANKWWEVEGEIGSSWEPWEPPSTGVLGDDSISVDTDLIDLQEADSGEKSGFRKEDLQCRKTEDKEDVVSSPESVWKDESSGTLPNLYENEDLQNKDALDDLETVRWSGTVKSREAVRIGESCGNGWLQASWQEWW